MKRWKPRRCRSNQHWSYFIYLLYELLTKFFMVTLVTLPE